MVGYIKRRRDFVTVCAAQLLDWDYTEKSIYDDKSTFVIHGDENTASAGDLFFTDGYGGVIREIDAGTRNAIQITCDDISALFSRDLFEITSFPAGQTVEQFTANQITANFVDTGDTSYDMGYITVETLTETDGNALPDTSNGLWNMRDYLQKIRRVYGVETDFVPTKNGITINLYARQPQAHKIFLQNPDYILVDESYSSDITAKITAKIAATGDTTDWYLLDDDTITTDATAPNRVSGEWRSVIIDDAAQEQTTVKNEFSKNDQSFTIEFSTERAFHFYDNVFIRTKNGRVVPGYITAVRRQQGTRGKIFKTGKMLLTIDEKLNNYTAATGGTSSSGGGTPEPGGDYMAVSVYDPNHRATNIFAYADAIRDDIPAASDDAPVMDGTAAVGMSGEYARADHVHPSDTSRVPTSRTVNGKPLSSNVTLTASDVDALPDTTVIPSRTSQLTNDSGYITIDDVPGGAAPYDSNPSMDGTANAGTSTLYSRGDHRHPSDTSRVPTTRTINGQALTGNITLDADDVGALPDDTFIPPATNSAPEMDGTMYVGSSTSYARADHVHPSDVSRVPATRKVNGKPLSADVVLGADDVGALPDTTEIPRPSPITPLMDGVASLGSGTAYARGNHRHPSDTTRLSTSGGEISGDLTVTGNFDVDGTATAPTPPAGTNNTRIATTAFVQTAVAGASGGGGTPYDDDPEMDGSADPGSSNEYARGDHKHPSDTSRLPKSGGTVSGSLTVSGTFRANGTAYAPTVAVGTDNTRIATTAFVNSSIENVTRQLWSGNFNPANGGSLNVPGISDYRAVLIQPYGSATYVIAILGTYIRGIGGYWTGSNQNIYQITASMSGDNIVFSDAEDFSYVRHSPTGAHTNMYYASVGAIYGLAYV